MAKDKTIGQPTLNGNPINITDSWNKVTFAQYLRILQLKDDTIELVSILTGVDYEQLKKAKQIKGLNKILYLARFLKTEPKFPDKPKKIGKYKLPLNSNGIFDIQFESLPQFEDMRVVMNKAEKGIYGHTVAYAKYCSIYVQKIRDGEYDGDKAMNMVEEVMGYPASDVISAGAFFFVKLMSLSSGTEENYPNTPLVRRKPIGKRSKKPSARTLPLTRLPGR